MHSDLSSTVTRLRLAGCVFAEDEAELLTSAAHSPDELTAMVNERVAGQPLEYVLGWASFYGLRITVRPGVFIPRRRTEFLVEQAAAVTKPGAVVLDLCCGSGAIGAALAATVGEIELHAVDIDPVAVQCARENLRGAHIYHGDLYDPLPPTLKTRVDVLVANAPYVPTEAMPYLPREARTHEPSSALDGGEDGLGIQRRILAGAAQWLAPNGYLLTETSDDQAQLTVAAFVHNGLTTRVVTNEESNATVVIGRFH